VYHYNQAANGSGVQKQVIGKIKRRSLFMLIVAERINSSRKSIYEAMEQKNKLFIHNEAIAQANAGADYIDVNAGLFAAKEVDNLAWLVDVVQEVTTLPLCVDSSNPEVIKSVLPRVERTPMLNSITLDKERFDLLLPLIMERSCKIIGLCQSDEKAAHTTSEKTDMAQELIMRLSEGGVPVEDIFIDPLVFPLATDIDSARSTLDAFSTIRNNFPEVHLICGLTNVSFGLPERKLINRSFLGASIVMGLDAVIIDPTDRKLMASLKAGLLITGKDPFSRGYIESFRNGLLSAV
jgi:5-methyltetrahydrofolate--homocysteine methyltransferase